jgi:hypothetical protein
MRTQKRTVLMVMALCFLLSCCTLLAFGAGGSGEPAAAPASATPAAAPAAPAASPTTAEVSERVDDMQSEIERLRNEVSEIERLKSEVIQLRQQLSATPQPLTSAALVQDAAAPQTGTPAAAAAAAPATPPPSAMATALGAISVTGFFDGYYAYTFGHPTVNAPNTTFGNPTTFPLATTGFSGAPAPLVSGFRAFTSPDRQFGFNLAELAITKAPDADNRLGFNLTFGFGNAMNVVNTTEPGTLAFSQYLKEGYLSYNAPIGKGLQIDFGKFVTPAGAEVIETMTNWNYTHSILFTYAIPFYHYGARAKYTFNDKVNLTGYAVNGWNNIVENNTGKTWGLSLAVNPTKQWGFIENYFAGPEQPGISHSANSHWRQLSDTVVTFNPTSKLSLMFNGDFGDDHPLTAVKESWWAGAAGYLKYQLDPKWAVAGRYEYYDDHAGFTTGVAGHYHEFTATLERKIAGNLITRWEYRYDLSNNAVFAESFTPEKHQSQVVGGLIYTWDFKDLK